VATLRLRWSEHEARKPYARPFMVSFVDDDDDVLGSVALSGADLLYSRQFCVAVAALSGELFRLDQVDAAPNPQRAWLEILTGLMPGTEVAGVTPRSTFDHDAGRIFGFEVACTGGTVAVVDAPTLLEYQEFQAALAHQTGRLLRVPVVEAVDDSEPRRRAWLLWLSGVVSRPGPEEAMAAEWPWH
jgi:hypothetical protein